MTSQIPSAPGRHAVGTACAASARGVKTKGVLGEFEACIAKVARGAHMAGHSPQRTLADSSDCPRDDPQTPDARANGELVTDATSDMTVVVDSKGVERTVEGIQTALSQELLDSCFDVGNLHANIERVGPHTLAAACDVQADRVMQRFGSAIAESVCLDAMAEPGTDGPSFAARAEAPVHLAPKALGQPADSRSIDATVKRRETHFAPVGIPIGERVWRLAERLARLSSDGYLSGNEGRTDAPGDVRIVGSRHSAGDLRYTADSPVGRGQTEQNRAGQISDRAANVATGGVAGGAMPAPAPPIGAQLFTAITGTPKPDGNGFGTASAGQLTTGAAPAAARGAHPVRVLEIALAPAELGEVTITLRGGEGGLSVAVVAQVAETVRKVEMETASLRQLLQGAGYSVDDITVVRAPIEVAGVPRADADSRPAGGAFGQPSGQGAQPGSAGAGEQRKSAWRGPAVDESGRRAGEVTGDATVAEWRRTV